MDYIHNLLLDGFHVFYIHNKSQEQQNHSTMQIIAHRIVVY